MSHLSGTARGAVSPAQETEDTSTIAGGAMRERAIAEAVIAAMPEHLSRAIESLGIKVEVAIISDQIAWENPKNQAVLADELAGFSEPHDPPKGFLPFGSSESSWNITTQDEDRGEDSFKINLRAGAEPDFAAISDSLGKVVFGFETQQCFADMEAALEWAKDKLMPAVEGSKNNDGVVKGSRVYIEVHAWNQDLDEPMQYNSQLSLIWSPSSPEERILKHWGPENLLDPEKFPRQHDFQRALRSEDAAIEYIASEGLAPLVLTTPIGRVTALIDQADNTKIIRDEIGGAGSGIGADPSQSRDLTGCAEILLRNPRVLEMIESGETSIEAEPLSANLIGIRKLEARGMEGNRAERELIQGEPLGMKINPEVPSQVIVNIPSIDRELPAAPSALAQLAELVRQKAPLGGHFLTDNAEYMGERAQLTATYEHVDSLPSTPRYGARLALELRPGMSIRIYFGSDTENFKGPLEVWSIDIKRALDGKLSMKVDECEAPIFNTNFGISGGDEIARSRQGIFRR